MEISIKAICFIYLVQAMTIIIDLLWGNAIVYLLKCKKGKKFIAQIVEVNCLFGAQRDEDVSVVECDNKLYAIPYDDKDKLEKKVVIHVYGKYVVREGTNMDSNGRKVLCILSIILLIVSGYIATNWNGIIDFMTLLLCIGLLLVYILVYPYIYCFYLYRIRKKLGWKVN